MRYWLSMLCALLAWGACAQEEDPIHFRFRHAHYHIVVNADGTFTNDYDAAYTLLTAAAVQEGSQAAFGYNPDFNSIDVVAAHVEHEDGSKVELNLADAVHDRSQTTAVDAPMLTQDRIKLLVFPNIKAGDTLAYHVRTIQHQSTYPGQFNFAVEQRLDQLTDDTTLTIDSPANMVLSVENVGYEASTSNLPNGMTRREWHLVNKTRVPYEENDLPVILTSPHVIVSTFAQYADLAAAYRTRATDKSTITPEVSELAAQIVGSETDPKQVALKLSDWVSRNIRYVALYFGAGGVVPVSAGDVLKNRYGDCKGHAVLLEALLKARGIDSTGALINLGGALYRLPQVPWVGGFDHIITYVPSLDLWLDSTATDLPTGSVQDQEIGKPALLVQTGEVKQVPVTGVQKTSTTLDAQMVLQESGDLDVDAHFQLIGPGSVHARQFFKYIQPQGRRDFVRDMLASDGIAGNGALLDTGEPDRLDKDFGYAYKATLYGYAAVPGPFGFTPPLLQNYQASSLIKKTAEYYVSANKPRRSEYVCSNQDRREHYTLTLPASVKLLSLPENLDIASGAFHYRGQYRVHGRQLEIDRVLESRRVSRICSADDYTRYRDFFKQVMGNLRSQVLYQPVRRAASR